MFIIQCYDILRRFLDLVQCTFIELHYNLYTLYLCPFLRESKYMLLCEILNPQKGRQRTCKASNISDFHGPRRLLTIAAVIGGDPSARLPFYNIKKLAFISGIYVFLYLLRITKMCNYSYRKKLYLIICFIQVTLLLYKFPQLRYQFEGNKIRHFYLELAVNLLLIGIDTNLRGLFIT